MNDLNLHLKLKIIEHYGGQWRFAAVIGEHESIVSKVMRCQRLLSDEKKRIWAKALRCNVEDIFTDASQTTIK